MQTFSIQESFKRAWELFKQNKKLLILSTIILMLASSVSKSKGYYGYREVLMIIISIIFMIVTVVLQIGWYKMLLKLEDGLKTKLHEMVEHENLFFKFIFTHILLGIITFIGFVLLIIPGIYFLLTYLFAPIIAIDSGLTIYESFTESARITKGNKMKLILLLLTLGLSNILGAMALIVGLLVSIPVSMLAYVHVYRTLRKVAPLPAVEAV